MLTLTLNPVQVLALAALGLAAGGWIVRRSRALQYVNVPGSVTGGLLFAAVFLALRDRVVNFAPDPVLQNLFMVAFFTAIGLGVSLRVVRRGGPQVVLVLALATLGAVIQNGVGIAAAWALGLDPLLGIVSGAVALTGGPGTSAAFGDTFERMGVPGAATVGVASAMFGITLANLVGGWLGGMLIRRNGLTPEPGAVSAAQADGTIEPAALLRHVILLSLAMGAGTLISAAIASGDIVLPGYIGAMIAAALLRNVDDATGWFGFSQPVVDTLGSVALQLFVVMALMNLRLWELAALAGPLLTILVLQALLIVPMCLVFYRLLGRDYEAAVMTGGFCGFMLGTTANAMACLTALTNRYGPAPRAFLTIPLVGGSLIDFTNAVVIVQMANWVR